MKVYRALWLAVGSLLIVVGGSAAVVLAPAALGPWFVLLAVVGAILALCAASWLAERPLRSRPRSMSRSALIGAATACAIGGIAVLWGAAVVLLLMFIVAVTSPAFLRGCDRWLNAPADPSTIQLDDWGREYVIASTEDGTSVHQGDTSPELRDLTNMQLCRAWRVSHRALRNPSSLGQMLATVAERAKYLDEFERRNAGGLVAWLGSDVRSLDHPLPYLIGSRGGSPAIDWDDLTRLQD
jgi:hypothetical protein